MLEFDLPCLHELNFQSYKPFMTIIMSKFCQAPLFRITGLGSMNITGFLHGYESFDGG